MNDMWEERKNFNLPRHPPFTGQRRQEVMRQHAILKDVYIGDYDNYELGFRGDVHPDREISEFTKIADAFVHLTANESSLKRKRAIFCAIMVTRLTVRKDFHLNRRCLPSLLSAPEKARIVDYMYDTYGDALPIVVYLGGPAGATAADVSAAVN